MNKILCSVLMLLLLQGFSSCRNELDSLVDGHHRMHDGTVNDMKKTVRMSFGGDFITESEEPLQRAVDGQTLVGINVFRTEKDKADAKEEKYAYGLFKSLTGLKIDVITGYTYRFEASILIEYEDKLFDNNSRGYSEPFKLNYSQNVTGNPTTFSMTDVGSFHYTVTNDKGGLVDDGKRNYLCQIKSGIASVDEGTLWYPRVKRYYGENNSFDPGLSQTVDIDMKYCCFGLKFVVVNIPSGSVTVKDITKKDAIRDKNPNEALVFPQNLVLSEDNKEWEGLFSMHNLSAETETFNLQFIWEKAPNVKEEFAASVTIKPKTKKVLRLNVNGNPNYETKGDFNFILDSEELNEESETINQK